MSESTALDIGRGRESRPDPDNRMRVLTRSGSGPDHPRVEKVDVDVSDAAQLVGLFSGAQAVFHCIHGSNYSATTWAEELAAAAGVRAPRVAAVPGWVLRTMAVFSPGARELAETLYQFERAFVMDSRTGEAALGLRSTPVREAAAASVAWWRDQAQ